MSSTTTDNIYGGLTFVAHLILAEARTKYKIGQGLG